MEGLGPPFYNLRINDNLLNAIQAWKVKHCVQKN
jgi:hypothetical protein